MVYDLGNGRVLKIPRNKFQQVITLFFWGYLNPIRIVRKLISVSRMTETSLTKVKDLLKDVPLELAGHPQFIQDRAYEQDKALPLMRFLTGNDVEGAKKIIDQYVQHVFTCWALGFSEMTTNLTINHGLNEEGEVILLDIGELLTKKEEVTERLENKLWRTSWTYKYHMRNPAIRNYFDERMEKSMTRLNLEKYWNTSVP